MTQKDPAACSKGKVVALARALIAQIPAASAGSATQFVATSDGSPSAPAFLATDSDTGMYFGINNVLFATGGAQRFNISNAGADLVSGNLNLNGGALQAAGSVQASSDGTAAAPAFRGTDADTGMYFPAANQVALAAGAVSMLANVSTSQLNVGPGAASGTGTGTVNLAGNALAGGGANVQDHAVGGSVGTTSDVGGVHTNTGAAGATQLALPGAAALYTYTFVVTAAQHLRVDAATGDTIRLNSSVSASAGYVRSNAIGSSITLVAVDTTQWIATSIVGTWTVDS